MTISKRATARPPRPRCTVCGTPAGGDHGNRSSPHLRRYFTLIRIVFQQWPESHERQFSTSEECRAYLQMRAGHREIAASIPLAGLHKERAVILAEAAIRACGSNAFPVEHKGQLIIWKPKSIAFAKLGHMAAVALFADVEDVIRAETGLNPELLMKEPEEAT